MYNKIVENQKKFLDSLEYLSVQRRILNLIKLKNSIKDNEKEIILALKNDLGKNEFESYTNEIGFVYSSIDYAVKNLKSWNSVKKVKNDIAQMPGKSYIYPSHYGSVLIIGAYNYPFQLLFEPLIGAIAGGNTVVLKPSEFAENVENIISKIIRSTFKKEYICVATGDYKVNEELLELDFDYIFFTGSTNIGKKVMRKASEKLIPVTLELGGKSPVIVDKSADIKLAAKKIIWGKLINCGQTCVAPDYLLVHESIIDELTLEMKNTIRSFYGENINQNSEYGRIINYKHMDRLINILKNDKEKIVVGGYFERANKFIEPTILRDVDLSNASMKEELFGPILPVIKYKTIDDIKYYIKANNKPLALYVFTENDNFAEKIINTFSFGGGCVNDTISHVASKYLPFGGVGSSGVGKYHGEYSFKTFTYEKAIVKKSTKINVDLIFPPFKNKLKFIKKIIK